MDPGEDDDEGFSAVYVTHCHEPRFVMQFATGTENNIFLVDSTDDEEHLIALMNRAREIFYRAYPKLRT